MDKTSISVKQVSKSFKLPHEKHHGLKQAVINFRPRKKYEVQHVLKDISFEIKKGEFFGIVGRNGSGKSTLLKLLAQIYTPDTGAISVNGTLTPFIELGVGFNPELTGRENVYMNGALLGFDRKQTDRMYDDIVHFAELEKFMDQKLKNYSSGMQVRLAFSIAIRSKSDILLVDEVLAVGDEAFQKKCTKIFETYKATDKTVVLVTHDMSAVERFCDRAMLIHDGRAIEVGDPRRIAKLYSASNTEDYYQGEKAALKKEMARYRYFLQPRLTYKDGQENSVFHYGDTVLLTLQWRQDQAIKNLGAAILRQSGEYVFGSNTFKLKDPAKGRHTATYEVKLDIAPGNYKFQLALFGSTDHDIVEWVENGPAFSIEPSTATEGWGGLVYLDHQWE